jgi:hypothetical protein
MREILALQPDVGTPQLREPCRESKRRRTAHPGLQLAVKRGLEILGVQMLAHALLESLERRDEGFRHITTPEGTEAAVRIGELAGDGIGQQPGTI